jgi:hypothetical protein
MGGRSGRGVGVLLTAALLASCSATLPAFVEARDDWTQSDRIWEDFESRIFVDATMKTEAFRREYVAEYTRLFSLTKGQSATMLEAELAEAKDQHVVMAAIFFAEIDWEKLDPRHGIWDVRLQNDEGAWLRPTGIERLDTDNPTWKRLYPYIDAHDAFFELRFDRTLDDGRELAASGQPLHLVIAGAPAQVKLTWTAP